MPIQHSPPARQTRSQARAQAVLTPTTRAPLYETPEVPQLRVHLDRGAHPNYLLNSWNLFESQLFTLFGDPSEVRKAEAELDSLMMEEGGHVSLYIADFRSLVSRIGDWGERALIHHFRKGLPSMILDQLASHPSRINSLKDLMDVILELDTRFHERQK
ncbi:hypothetical protein O181_105721 [Austropuccinia psidii MF-1]|uniref:Retrotransposon gag domain-containing protein n=1 Tax=Austropuccinia psidii MF-1 TaxID=1389203 RepID=A0A9Q3JQ13_9BASI|nr:hypothetical protein [Austropuccinia psidii MF-1]